MEGLRKALRASNSRFVQKFAFCQASEKVEKGNAADENGQAGGEDGDQDEANETNGEVNETDGEANETNGEVNETNGEVNETDGEVNETDGEVNETDGEVNETDEEDEEEDDDQDEVDDEIEGYSEREVKIKEKSGGSKVEVKSEWKRNDLEDEFKVVFSTHREPKIKLEYATELNATETELEYKVCIEEIVEYIDTNSNSRYDENDTVISVYRLRDAEYKAINHTTGVTLDNETQHKISTTTRDGVFGIVLYVVGSFANLEAGTVAPTEVKIDFIINYNYTREDSQLALKVEVKTEHECETEDVTCDEDQGCDECQGYANRSKRCRYRYRYRRCNPR